jgi:hypothetical protein
VDQGIVGTWFDGSVGRLLHSSHVMGSGRSTLSVPVHRKPIVTTESIDVFLSYTMNIKNERDTS